MVCTDVPAMCFSASGTAWMVRWIVGLFMAPTPNPSTDMDKVIAHTGPGTTVSARPIAPRKIKATPIEIATVCLAPCSVATAMAVKVQVKDGMAHR